MFNVLRFVFDSLPSLAGLLLATLAFALVFVKELDEKLKDKRAVRWGLATVLSIIGVSALVSDLVQKAEEKTRTQNAETEQRKAVDGIKDQLQKSELQRVSDTRYLEGKLDVFAQFAPAIVKLAQATEENTRKQYEAKKLNNKELRDFTLGLVARMRDFEKLYKARFDTIFVKYRNSLNDPMVGQKEMAEFMPVHAEYENQFRVNFLADAVYSRDQLRARLNLPPEENRMPVIAFSGFLAGPSPVADAADYLEQMAKKLMP